jgi:signal transduction histidine kinase
MLAADLGSEPILVEADPLRITQVVSNLLDNAAKYTPDGGCIAVAVSRRSAEVHITVTDTGSGIPAEQLTNIFKPFTQLDTATPTRRGGLGLGLSLVQRLTELHGGSVHATSAGEGQGSCFTVRLPVSVDRRD